jgi:signal transduction histidine kinase
MSATVFLIGILSITLLVVGEFISNRQRIDFVRNDALMDAQLLASTAHLWLEEAISGDPDADGKKALSDLDRAIQLVDVTLDGGKSQHGWMIKPLETPELRIRAKATRALLVRLKKIGLTRLQDPEKSGIGSQPDQQFDAVFKELLEDARALDEAIAANQAGRWTTSRRYFHGILYFWIFVMVVVTTGLWILERQRKSAEEELLKANEQLMSQAQELREHRERLSGLVEKRTMELSTANQFLREENAEHRRTEETLKETEKQMRSLSSRLLSAQEIERKRISMELHDELGQALNVMKLQVRVLEKGLREDQSAIKKDCEKLLEYIDQVIEDVRRLSLDLSPTVLEDLGLTSALHWLISTFAKGPEMKVEVEIDEIDQLVPENYRIIVYRVIQEALTNVGKHSKAANVSVVIKRGGDKVTFLVEDDGKGFDMQQTGIKNSTEKGLGLTTMNERVRMIGGDFEIWSQTGKGARIYFSIPVGKGAAINGCL